MKKMLNIIICAVFASTLVIAAFVYITPKITPIDVTLSAQEWDGWSNAGETVEITIKGQLKEYLFKPDVLDIDVTSSDGVLNWDSQLFNTLPGNVTDNAYAYLDYNSATNLENYPDTYGFFAQSSR